MRYKVALDSEALLNLMVEQGHLSDGKRTQVMMMMNGRLSALQHHVLADVITALRVSMGLLCVLTFVPHLGCNQFTLIATKREIALLKIKYHSCFFSGTELEPYDTVPSLSDVMQVRDQNKY